MPTRLGSLDVQVLVHRTATALLAAVEPLVVPKREREANIFLPHAKKLRKRESSPAPLASSSTTAPVNQFWLTLWSTTGGRRSLDVVLACTSHHLGEYPIFLYSHHPAAVLSPSFLSLRVPSLVDRLAELVSSSRVFSVFGPTPLTSSFVSYWSRRTHVVSELEPFYAAKFTYCTPSTLTPPRTPLPAGDIMRQATIEDAEAAAVLCKDFADDSVYFPLSESKAVKEAKEMIRNKQLWVYYTAAGELASIVACTRTSEDVAAITKVYTNTSCRSRGCAERLVRRVCQYWFEEGGRRSVVLYVAHDNKPAAKVYHRVGFEGLAGRAVEGVEDWLETGFMGTERGHW